MMSFKVEKDKNVSYSTRGTRIIFLLNISKIKVNNLNNFEEEGEDVL